MASRSLRTFTVLPHLPGRLQGLQRVAYNMCWCWNHEAVSLFRRIDDTLFDKLDNSPIKLISTVGQERLDQLLRDDGFLAHLDRVVSAQDKYMNQKTWFQETYGRDSASDEELVKRYRMAYFSAEFGIHESVPIYSGGLGLLAGDHLKSASDLGLPLVGVGLMYREGYFRQYLNIDGWQQERYPENDFFNLPLISENKPGRHAAHRVDGADAGPRGDVSGPGVSRSAECHSICSIATSRRTSPTTATSPLGSMEATTTCASARKWSSASAASAPSRAVGKNPAVCHMNEGARRVRQAWRRVRVSHGRERPRLRHRSRGRDGRHLLHDPHARPGRQRRLLAAAHAALLQHLPAVAQNRLVRVPRPRPAERPRSTPSPTALTVLALKLANVSATASTPLHGVVSRKMWRALWPEASRGGDPDHGDHQRRPHPDVARRPRSGSSTIATSASSGKIGPPITASGNA